MIQLYEWTCINRPHSSREDEERKNASKIVSNWPTTVQIPWHKHHFNGIVSFGSFPLMFQLFSFQKYYLKKQQQKPAEAEATTTQSLCLFIKTTKISLFYRIYGSIHRNELDERVLWIREMPNETDQNGIWCALLTMLSVSPLDSQQWAHIHITRAKEKQKKKKKENRKTKTKSERKTTHRFKAFDDGFH